jgi:hypothetical protein
MVSSMSASRADYQLVGHDSHTKRSLSAHNIVPQHSVALCILNYRSHFSPFLRNFVDVFRLTLQKHSSLLVTRTLHVSAQLAVIRCTSCRISRCTLLHFAFLKCKILTKYFKIDFKYHTVTILLFSMCNR